MGVGQDANGFTTFTPSIDSRIVYCSSSDGDDNTGKIWVQTDPDYAVVIGPDPRNPLQPTNLLPYATPEAVNNLDSDGARNGFPDWRLYKSGDIWLLTGSILNNNFPNYNYGRSDTEMRVLASYGAGARPEFDVPSLGGGIRPVRLRRGMQYCAIVGLDFYKYTRDPANPAFDLPNVWADTDGHGIDYREETNTLGPHYSFWIEDCRIRWFGPGKGLTIQHKGNTGFYDFRFRRNIVTYNSGVGYYQGAGAHEALIEGNVWFHNGWYEDRATGGQFGTLGEPSILKHNIYYDNENPNNTGGNTGDMRGKVVVFDNIFSEASSHGIQMRAGGTCERNVFYREPIAINTGSGDSYDIHTPEGADSIVRWNWIEAIIDISPTLIRGVGIKNENCREVELAFNVMRDNAVSDVNVGFMKNDGDNLYMNVHHNVSYNQMAGGLKWGIPAGSIEEYNKYWDWTVTGTNTKSENETFTDPTRTLAAYDAFIGGPGTADDFYQTAINRAPGVWDPNYAGENATAWLLAGFDIDVGAVPPLPANQRGTIRVRAKARAV